MPIAIRAGGVTSCNYLEIAIGWNISTCGSMLVGKLGIPIDPARRGEPIVVDDGAIEQKIAVRSRGIYSLNYKTMADPITPAISDRICKHMNDDHADAVLTYAKVYGNSPTAETAAMSAIDPLGMDLTASVAGETVSLRIPFDRELTDSEDAHQTLIGMIKEARKMAG